MFGAEDGFCRYGWFAGGAESTEELNTWSVEFCHNVIGNVDG